MSLLSHGADAVPAAEPTDQNKKRFRLLVVGKKSLPDPEATGEGKGSGRNQVFWSTITTVGEDLKKLQDGLGPKEYETKTRGTRFVSTSAHTRSAHDLGCQARVIKAPHGSQPGAHTPSSTPKRACPRSARHTWGTTFRIPRSSTSGRSKRSSGSTLRPRSSYR